MTEYQRDLIESLTDKELVGELRRRGRFLEVEASGAYYTDMKDDDGYMRHCDEQIVRVLVAQLRNKLIPKIVDRIGPTKHVATRNASVIVLLSREQAEQERHEAAKSDAALSGLPATA